ncbi:hypothetical protein GF1_13100 [Desulfolithobacter dissulfuricans]|uniref:Uncharacterized protein n=1 Tax=Desulfolithobacter dissulfuricans TaxID=2795293 RepID=A0A915U0W6_9BACT|nr:hypothetical protein GF1_13100 [Desulfolithobacter dissulfuricans]
MVALGDPPLLEIIRQPGQGLFALGHHHDPGRVLVEPMDNARPALLQGRQVSAVVQQAVDQCSRGMAGRRMHNQARRLDQDQEMGIFEKNIKGYRLGLQL